MAIYSCNLRSIGRTTHEAGTAGAHMLYISRPSENPILISEHIPIDGNEARAWMNAQEKADRKNARVADKLRIALPRELTDEQRVEVVRSYLEDITKGNQVPWYAAFHDMGEDAHNPHVHIVIRDRSIATGKRLIGLSDSKRDWIKKGNETESPTQFVRKKWEDHANDALEKYGHDVCIDRRSLEDQGIDRIPQIHEGPQARQIETMVERPRSKSHTTGNGRVIDYPAIDQGKTRIERNAEIIDLNLERAARSPHFETRYRALFEKEQAKADRDLASWIAKRQRLRTKTIRDLKRGHSQKERRARESRDLQLKTVKSVLSGFHRKQITALRATHFETREELRLKHNKVSFRLYAIFDLTGRTRASRKAERAELRASQGNERRSMVSEYRNTLTKQSEAILEESKGQLDNIAAKKDAALAEIELSHIAEIQLEQDRLQGRERERESHRAAIDLAIAAHKRELRVKTGNSRGDVSVATLDDLARSPNRKPRVKGDKAARMRRAKERKAEITRVKNSIRDDFEKSGKSAANDSERSFEDRLQERLEREKRLKAQGKDKDDPSYRR